MLGAAAGAGGGGGADPRRLGGGRARQADPGSCLYQTGPPDDMTVHTCHVSRVTVTRGSEVKVLAAVSPHRAAGGGGAAAGGRGGVRRLQGVRPGPHGGGSACHVTSCHVM